MGTHYGIAQNPAKMRKWAERTAPKLIAFVKKYEKTEKKRFIPVLCYTGMSGIVGATFLSNYLLDHTRFGFYMAYVRKSRETSHSTNNIENEKIGTVVKNGEQLLIFIDDFIAGGDTFSKVVAKLSRHPIIRQYVHKSYVACLYDHTNDARTVPHFL